MKKQKFLKTKKIPAEPRKTTNAVPRHSRKNNGPRTIRFVIRNFFNGVQTRLKKKKKISRIENIIERFIHFYAYNDIGGFFFTHRLLSFTGISEFGYVKKKFERPRPLRRLIFRGIPSANTTKSSCHMLLEKKYERGYPYRFF